MIKYDFFLVFLLAHLIGDFAFQTGKIASLKSKCIKGVFIHSCLVTVVQAVMLSFYGVAGVLCGLAAGCIHFLIDYIKLLTNKYSKNKSFIFFVIDQAAHLSVIFFFSYAIRIGTNLPPNYVPYVEILISIIIVAFTANVAVMTLIRDFSHFEPGQNFFKKFERLAQASIALILWAVFFLPCGWAIILCITAFIFYNVLQIKFFKGKLFEATLQYIFFILVVIILHTAFQYR